MNVLSKQCYLAVAIISFFSTFSAIADDSFPKVENTIRAGGILNTGNSRTTTITSQYTRTVIRQHWSYSLDLSGQLATSQGVESARTIEKDSQINYNISKNNYIYGHNMINYDKFGTYNLVFQETVGVGRHLLQGKRHQLSIETGLGAIHRRIASTSIVQGEALWSSQEKYQWQFSTNASLRQTLSADISHRNNHFEFTTGVRTNMLHNLAVELSFKLNHDTVIPSGSDNRQKTDTASQMTLVYTPR